MGAPLALARVLEGGGLLLAALPAAGALILRAPRARALAVLVTLAVTPALLVVALASAGALDRIVARPLLVALAAAIGLAAVAGLAALFRRHPAALPVLVVGALPFRLPLELGGQSANLLVPLYLVVAAGSLAYAAERLRPAADGRAPGERPPGRVELALAVALVLYAAQSAYSTDVDQAFKNVVFFYAPFALLLRLLAAVRWSPRLIAACLGVAASLAVVFASVGFWEFATRRLLLNPKVIAANQFQSYFRVNSLFFDPNVYGRFLALVMVALAVVLLWTGRRRVALLVAGALAVLWAGLVLTFSQSSFAALLVGLAVVAALRWRPRPVLVAVAAAAAAATAALALFPALVRLEGSARSLDRATSGRLGLVRGGLEMFADRPLWGYGSGAFVERFRAREDPASSEGVPASHTTPVTVAAEQGVVGLAAYGFVLVAAFGLLLGGLGSRSPRAPPVARRAALSALAAAFSALVVHTLLYAAFLEDPLTWAILGVGLGLRHGAPDPPAPPPAAAPRAEALPVGT